MCLLAFQYCIKKQNIWLHKEEVNIKKIIIIINSVGNGLIIDSNII